MANLIIIMIVYFIIMVLNEVRECFLESLRDQIDYIIITDSFSVSKGGVTRYHSECTVLSAP